MSLERVRLPRGFDEDPIGGDAADLIERCRRFVEAFMDCWDVHRVEQYVAADHALVYRALRRVRRVVPPEANRFLEWGGGLSVVALLADHDGWDAVSIESHPALIAAASDLRSHLGLSGGQVVRGNFLPEDAESLADDPTLPSLGHGGEPAYEDLGLEIDDFAVVYSYPWPGEDAFHRRVFDRYAADDAVLIQFLGPNDVGVWRKGNRRGGRSDRRGRTLNR